MSNRGITLRHFLPGLIAVSVACFAGCSDRDFADLELAPLNDDPLVFGDTFGDGVDFQAFLGSNTSALSIVSGDAYAGTSFLRFSIPEESNPNGGWAGGAFVSSGVRDLSGYNALTFYARASEEATLNVVGLANDNTGNSKYSAEWPNVRIGESWQKYVVPIPLPEKLTEEQGLIYLAEAEGIPYDLDLDEIRFEYVTGISDPRPSLVPQTVRGFVGSEVSFSGTRTIFSVNGTDQFISHLPGYFTFFSSDEDVAVVGESGVEIVGQGKATITAKLGDIDATGEIMINSIGAPTEPAPAPSFAAGDVVSVFSNAYTNVGVDRWTTEWGTGVVEDVQVDGNDVKAYSGLEFTGIEFTSAPINASEMTHFAMDLWVSSGSTFGIKLVDFGEDGVFGGAADSEHEISYSDTSDPAIAAGQWIRFDIPLESFADLTSREHLAQLIISTDDVDILFIDNVLFHR